jgi:hypothetical protein
MHSEHQRHAPWWLGLVGATGVQRGGGATVRADRGQRGLRSDMTEGSTVDGDHMRQGEAVAKLVRAWRRLDRSLPCEVGGSLLKAGDTGKKEGGGGGSAAQRRMGEVRSGAEAGIDQRCGARVGEGARGLVRCGMRPWANLGRKGRAGS